jgi:hypothetical protein
MHGFINASSTIVVSNPVAIVTTSNFTIVTSNFAKVQMQQMVAIQSQAITWKPNSRTSLCWGFFVVNDNLLVDLEKLQMLQCIICKIKQVGVLDLCQHSNLRKGLIKYGKINGITPMRTHVESMHRKLVGCRKLAITKKLIVVVVSHNRHRKKQSWPFGCAITSYFSATNLYKKFDEAQQ